MAIIGGAIVNTEGVFSYDKKDITVEWLVFSDDINAFTVSLYLQGLAGGDNLLINGEPAGWLQTGLPYRMGDEYSLHNIAGEVRIFDRKIIRGEGSHKLQISDNNIVLIPIAPEGIVQFRASQKFTTIEQEKKYNPLPSVDDKFSISTDVEYIEVPFERDVRTGKQITNSAGQKFNPPVTYRKAITVYTLSRTEFINPILKSRVYRNAVNSDAWYGADPGTVLMDSISPGKEKDSYWEVSYKFKYNPDGWQIYILDTGTMQKDSAGSLSAILDKEQVAVQEPVKLDGNGKALEDQTQDGVDIGPHWSFVELPFAPLDIPDFGAI